MSKRARKPEPAWLQHVGHALFVALFLFCCYHSVDWIWTGQMYCVPLYTGNAPFYVTWPDSPFSFVLGLIFWLMMAMCSLALFAETGCEPFFANE
jgi:hypothetical protein